MRLFENHSRFPLFSGLRSGVALLLSTCVLLSGCVSMQSVPSPVSGQPQSVPVMIGDRVEVQTKSGAKLAFKVTAIEADALVGKAKAAVHETRVQYQDIATLRVERLDKGRTTMAIVGTVVAVVGLLWVAAANAYSGGYLGL